MTGIIKTFSLTALLISVCLTLDAQTTRSRLEADFTRGGGIYHSYEFDEIDDVKAPKGYKPFYITHYGRHGSRFHDSYVHFGTLNQLLHQADSAGNLTPDGALLLAQTDSVLAEHHKMLGNVTAKGLEEHKRIARRMSARFPEVFNDRQRNRIDAYSSIVRRCIVSMAGSTATLLQLNPSLDLYLYSDDRVYSYINLGHHVSADSKKFFLPYQDEALSRIDWTGVKEKIFKDPSSVSKASAELAQDIWNYWNICQDIESVNIDIFRYFTFDQLYENWKVRSGYFYLMFVRSKEYGNERLKSMKPLVDHFITHADQAIASGKTAATLRYGHDTTLLPLAAVMGLENFSRTHSIDDMPSDYWDLSTMIGMASNLQMVFYKNRHNDIIVKFLYNEKESAVPELTPAYGKYFYSWDAVRTYLTDAIK